MKRFLYFIVLLLIVSCQNNQSDPTTITWKEMSRFPDSIGRSAVVAGMIDGRLVVGGGANFPDSLPQFGGKKKIYSDIYLLENDNWKMLAGGLPEPVAYAVSCTADEGIIVAGGTSDGKTSSPKTYLLTSKGIRFLSDMPYSLDNAAGALMGRRLYVSGGLHDGVPSKRAFVLDIDKNEWKELPPLPGIQRVQPVASVQNGAEEKIFIIFGGFDPQSKSVLKDGWAYYPSSDNWKELHGSDIALNGGTAFPMGIHSVLFTGGVNEQIFTEGITTDDVPAYQSHDREWYRFNDKLLFYNTIVDRWAETGSGPFPLAGSQAVSDNDGVWMVMGETQPGVRTSSVWYGSVQRDVDFGWVNWTVLALYLVGMLLMGVYFMRRQKTSDHYFTGGQRIPWWAVSVSIFATMLSAITFMAIPAKTFATDWRYFIMAITIFFVAFPVIRYFLPFFRRLNITTAYQYLELRFNAAVRILASLLFIFFMVARMALVIYLPSLALTAATGIDIFLCIVLMSIITVFYSSMGGIEAVVWGDVVQGIILMGGAIFTLIYLIMGTDGNAFQIALENDKFNILNWSFDFTSATFWVVLLGGAVNSFISYSSDQAVIQRYMTTSDEKKAAKSIFTNGILSVISSFLFYSIGTALFCYFMSRPSTLDFSMPTADSIFPFYIMTRLPVGIAGVLIAAIFAASMSTISANINSISTAWIVDIRPRFKWCKQDDRSKLRAARSTSVVVGILGCLLAILMAIWNVLSLFDWFNMVLGLLTGGLCALFVMGIFIERIDGKSALIGFLTGSVAIFFISANTNLFFLMYGLVSIVIAIVVALLCSYLLPSDKKNLDGLTWNKRPKEK